MAEPTYDLGGFRFDAYSYLPDKAWGGIVDIRVSRPENVTKDYLSRRKRPKLTLDGKLTILACDHPGRMVTKSGDDPLLMGDRRQYLARILRVVTDPRVDGVMSTPDIIDELMTVNRLFKEAGGRDFLDEKVLIGCLNRGGLSGTVFELDDTFTAFTPKACVDKKLDAAKLMFRLDVNSEGSLRTITASAQAVSECVGLGLPIFIEALMVERQDGAYKVKKNADDLVRVAGVASALGHSSHGTWLKLPFCEQYDRVARATTCPILMLGGESLGNPIPTLMEFAQGMQAGPNIRGALVGRNVLFPGDDDPLAVAVAINAIVHQGVSAEEAAEILHAERGANIGVLAERLG